MSYLKEKSFHEDHPHLTPADMEPSTSSEVKSPDWEHISSILEKEVLSKEVLSSYLILAIKNNNSVMLQQLIYHGTKHDTSYNYEFMLPTALRSAYPEMIAKILNHCGFLGNTDMPKFLIDGTHDRSCDSRYKKCVEILLERGYEVLPKDFECIDIIFEAARNGYLWIVSQYIQLKLCVNLEHPILKLNLLTVACLNKHHKIVEELLQKDVETEFEVSIINPTLQNHQTFGPNLQEFLKLCSPDRRSVLTSITCFHIAVLNSDLETMNILIKYDVDIIDYEDLLNLTCLAAQNGWYKIVDRLLDLDVEASHIHSSGKTLLHFCIHADTEEDYGYKTAKILLDNGALTHLTTLRHQLAVAAAYHGHTKTSRLFKYYVCVPFFEGCRNPTLLHEAIEEQIEIEIIADLLKTQETVNFRNSDGHTTLHVACKQKTDNRLEVIELLLRHGADIDAEDFEGRTVLHKACETQDLELATYLLKCAADPNYKDHNGRTPLHVVGTLKGGPTLSMVESFLEVNKLDTKEEDGYTQLLKIYRRGQAHRYHINTFWSPISMDLVDVLVEHGADICIRDNEHQTALHIACVTGNVATVRSILNYASPYGIDDSGSSLLHHAVRHHEWDPHFFEMLMSRQISVNHQDDAGKSILHYIAEKKDGKISEKYDSVEFNVDIVDKDGNTPLHLAVKNLNGEMFAWLMKNGANVNIINKENKTVLNEAMEVLIGKKKCRKNIDHLRRLKAGMISKLRMKVIALHIAELEVSPHNLNIIYGNDQGLLDANIDLKIKENSKLVAIENQCKYELKYLKDNKILGDFTFFDLLKDHIAVAKRCVRDHDLLETLKQKKYDESYPMYIEMMRNQLRKTYCLKKRYELVDPMIRFFTEFIKGRSTNYDPDQMVQSHEIAEMEVYADIVKSHDDYLARKKQRIHDDPYLKFRNTSYFHMSDFIQRLLFAPWWN